MLRSAQQLEDKADENYEVAEQHMIVMDWYSTLAEPEEEDENVPLDEQLDQLRSLAQDQLNSAAEVCTMPSLGSNQCMHVLR